MNLFKGGGIYVIEKVVHKVKLTIERILQRQKHCNLHIINIFTRRRDIASCPLTKQNHLGKYSNGKLRTSEVLPISYQHSTILKY